ncbi:MAG: spore protease YyaC [Niameybacter sp.]|uniref:spore protease YyaC n=1 Tax=Niameybacter sp. TaxID=2033640 RepID=UPI002FC5941E
MDSTLLKRNKPHYISIDDSNHFTMFCDALYNLLAALLPEYNDELVIICIGTDRATGDSLGPLIGYKLLDLEFEKVHIYGNLDTPVHAKNLEDITVTVQNKHPHALVIAIDACLGTMQNVGSISIGEGSIKPGAGVQKELTPIGNLHITGIVNFSSFMNMVVLQNTRLSIVMRMADIISGGIRHCIFKYYEHK